MIKTPSRRVSQVWDDDHEVQELYRYTSFDRLANKKEKQSFDRSLKKKKLWQVFKQTKTALIGLQKYLRHQLVKKHCLQVGVPARIC